MARVLKWCAIGSAGLLALVVLAMLLLPSLVGLERYRTLLAGRVGKALGREVTLGALTVSIWRGIGAEAQGVRISQAPGFDGEPFLAADTLRVHLQLLPLLRGQVKVSSLGLERPRIRVLRGAEGQWSTEDLLRPAPPAANTKSTSDPPRPGKGSAVGAVLISELAVRDGEIQIADLRRPGAPALRLTGVSLRARQATLAEPIEITSRAEFPGPSAGTVESSGRISLGSAEGPVLDLGLRLTSVQAAAWREMVSPSAGAAAFTGSLSGEMTLTGPLSRLAFGGRLELKELGVAIGERFAKGVGEEAALSFQGTRVGPGLTLSAWRLGMREMTLDGALEIPDLARPHLAFTLTSPRLDLDRLLAKPKTAGAWLLPATAWAAPEPTAAAPAALGLTVAGAVSLGELAYLGLTWRGVEADLRYQEGILRVPRVRATFYDGTVQAQAEVDLRGRMPRTTVTSRLGNVATEPLVQALKLGSWTLQSRLNLESQLSFVGLALPEILGSASGRGSLRLGEGRVLNYRPLERLGEVLAPILAGQGVRVRLNEFTELGGTYTLDNGILRSRDMTLTKTEGTVTASGALGILDRSVNADVVARLGRTTAEARVTGTTDRPIVIPKLGRLQRKLETEIDKQLPGDQGKGLKDLFRKFFGR